MDAPTLLIRPASRSKTLVTWLGVVGGSFGLHRFYLRGWRDPLAWAHPWPTLAGLYGVQRMRTLGQDDVLSWLLIPLLGVMIAATMLVAIVHGLTPDERWNARWNAGRAPCRTGWLAVLGVIAALMLGGGVLMATIAFSAERWFTWSSGPLT